jgi:CDP-diacylglycerol--glycerol-3-phosphate 3-phosphatidyltransferase
LTLTDKLRKRAFFVIDPIVTFLARHNVSPNLLTTVGMLGHLLIAWLVIEGRMQLAALGILVFVPLDALDGSLARKLGRDSMGFGAFLDSTLDRLAEIILFGGFLIFYGRQGDAIMVATSYIAITGSVMVSYARARAEALGFSCKVGILSRVERYIVITLALLFSSPQFAFDTLRIGLIVIAIFAWVTVAQRLYHVWKQANQT